MDKYLENNKAVWNEATPIHEKSAFYDVAGFKAGRCTLKSIELEEMGDVTGKSLLHLQCHFGLDTLSWGRRGAQVTGVDFSGESIKLARRLSEETGITADFICSDIYDLPEVLKSKFDIVFTSYGVLTWLPDLKKWGEIVAHFLKPGGYFYIAEFHPITMIYDDSPDSTELEIILSYFQGEEPLKFDPSHDYASGVPVKHGTFEWQYPLGDVVTALINAGLHLEFLHEFPVCCYKGLPVMKKDDDGWWRIDGDPIPLTFSIKATKPL